MFLSYFNNKVISLKSLYLFNASILTSNKFISIKLVIFKISQISLILQYKKQLMLLQTKKPLAYKYLQSTQLNQTKMRNRLILQKITTSELQQVKRQEIALKHIKSQPELEQIQEFKQVKQQNKKGNWCIPRFTRSRKEASLKKHSPIKFQFLSPPPRNNILIHQPLKPQPSNQVKPYKTQIIPPSNLNHDKMKNFFQNPERFLLNVQEQLDTIFIKSKQSIIKNAKVVPVKDWEIRDSTDLLDGFTGIQ